MRRFISVILITFIAFNSAADTVYASGTEGEPVSISEDDIKAYEQFLISKGGMFSDPILQGCYYIFSALGYAYDQIGLDGTTLYSMADSAAAAAGYVSLTDYIKQHSSDNGTPNDTTDDYVTYTKEFVANFQLQINNYMADNYGYSVYPASTQNDTWLVNHMGYYSNAVSYKAVMMEFFASHDFVLYGASSSDFRYCYMYGTSGDDIYFVLSGNKLIPYNADCEAVTPDIQLLGYGNGNVVGMSTNQPYYRMDEAVKGDAYGYYRFKNDTKVFKSAAALNEYVNGSRVLYQMSGINDRIQDLTFTVGALNADWMTINQESMSAILKAIEDKMLEIEVDTLTEQQLQQVVDAVISSRLDEINKTIQSGNDMNSHQNQLIYEKLQQIYTLLLDWYKKDPVAVTLDVDLTPITVLLADIKAELTMLVTCINDFDINIINNNTFNTEFDTDIVINTMQPSVERMKSTFPFCLPWDVYYCFSSLAASPEVPHWDIPVVTAVGEYTLVIDLSDFQVLSDISRAFLSLLFILYLCRFSLKLWEVM